MNKELRLGIQQTVREAGDEFGVGATAAREAELPSSAVAAGQGRPTVLMESRAACRGR
jgi:hypothetical protein